MLGKVHIGDDRARLLAKGDWPDLKSVYLCTCVGDVGSCHIGEEGLYCILRAPWARLESLELFENDFGSLSFSYLNRSNWPYLQTIDICTSWTIIDNKFEHWELIQCLRCNWKYLNAVEAEKVNRSWGSKMNRSQRWAMFTYFWLELKPVRQRGMDVLRLMIKAIWISCHSS